VPGKSHRDTVPIEHCTALHRIAVEVRGRSVLFTSYEAS
jgi:hypothetical protein